MLYRNRLLVLLFLLSAASLALAQKQSSEVFEIPLSDPNAPGKLRVDLHDGSITVEGYSGKDVILSLVTYGRNEGSSTSKNGLKRIPNVGSGFEIVEADNVVMVQGSRKSRMDFIIKVPWEFSLYLGAHHNGDIKVNNVKGEFELDSHHGGIKLTDIEGAVVADTHHGAIVANFKSIQSNTPMAFSTYHGDVDITFPASTNATVKMRSEKGDIYTDFDLQLNTPKPKTVPMAKGGSRIEVSQWIQSDIGSGGPSFMFTTHHGDVILRKAD